MHEISDSMKENLQIYQNKSPISTLYIIHNALIIKTDNTKQSEHIIASKQLHIPATKQSKSHYLTLPYNQSPEK